MVEVGRKIPDGDVIVTASSIVDRFTNTFGLYGWFALTEVVLLAVAFVLNTVFEMPIVAGLIGAVVLLMGINVILIFAGQFVYRFHD